MTYELAKELKDAGFPQHKDINLCEFQSRGCWSDCCWPTLEELIEACGEGFNELYRRRNHMAVEDRWVVYTHPTKKPATINGEGSTPIEAVARLWLALNK